MVTVLRNSLLLLGAMVVAFLLLKDNMDLLTAAMQQAPTGRTSVPERSTRQEPSENDAPSDENQLVIEAGAWGHFHVDADIGGREIGFLVDTGASMVALTQEDADTIGLPVHQLDYSGRAHTANGVARMAPVMIDEIRIGDIVIRNVKAAVIEGHTGKSLLGMTFLNKLAGFEVKNNRLYLRW